MKQSIKRTIVILSFAFNAGFMVAIVVAFVNESSERQPQDLVSQHYEFYHKLNLTAQQDSVIDSLLAFYLARQQKLRIQAFALERQLKDVALSAVPDSVLAISLTSQIAAIRDEQESLTLQHLHHVRTILTPSQRRQMNSMLEDYFHQRERQQ